MLFFVYIYLLFNFKNALAIPGYHSHKISRILREWNHNATDEQMLKELPQWQKGEPVHVQVGIFLENIANLKIKEMSLDVDMYLELSWYDERFKNASFFDGQPVILVTEHEDIERIWKPDFFFLNTRQIMFNDMLKPNHGYRLYDTGEVQYSIRIVMTVACPMNFRNFPFDRQTCNITMLTYNSHVETISAMWYLRQPIDSNHLTIPEMLVVNTTAKVCNGNYSYSFFDDKFLKRVDNACLVAQIHFDRTLGHYLMEIYFPTGLCVVISWLNFWISPTAVPARVSLSFTTLLTLYTAANKVKADLPDVWYPKAVDYWIGMCIAFVFASLIEYAAINHTMTDLTPNRISISDSKLRMQVQWAKKIDRISSILFPLAFFIFNLIYWIYYKIFT